MVIEQKQGFIRIVEAFIAVMVIAGVMSYIYVAQINKPNEEEQIHQLEKVILDQISSDQNLREGVLNNNIVLINNTINSLIPSSYAYNFKICDINEICGLDYASSYYTKNEIYSEDVAITATLQSYDPKKIRIFVWVK